MQVRNTFYFGWGVGSRRGNGEICSRLRSERRDRGRQQREGQHSRCASIGDNARFVRPISAVKTPSVAPVQTALDRFKGLHGVVNCAGVGRAEKTVGKDGPHSLASFARIIQINLIGTFNVIRLAAAAMSVRAATSSGERGLSLTLLR